MKRAGHFLTIFAACTFLLIACDGNNPPDGSTHTDGGNPTNKDEPCATNLDETKVNACYGTISSGGTVVAGEAGATDPGATVTITGNDGDTRTVTAGDDGSFAAALPASLNSDMCVTAKKGECKEKKITIKVVRCP